MSQPPREDPMAPPQRPTEPPPSPVTPPPSPVPPLPGQGLPAPSPASDPASGWTPPSTGRSTSRRGWVIGCAVLLIVALLGVGGCAVLVWRGVGGAVLVVAGSHGEISSFRMDAGTSGTSIMFQAARGLDEADGPRLACDIVRPNLDNTDLADATWIIVNRAGDVIASDQTPCP